MIMQMNIIHDRILIYYRINGINYFILFEYDD